MKHWELLVKPPKYECPEEYCFHWRNEGTFVAPGLYNNLESAVDKLKYVSKSHCGFSFGVCIREKKRDGTTDWYEPHETNLNQVGLPWFYFLSDPDKLCPTDKEKYIEYFKLK